MKVAPPDRAKVGPIQDKASVKNTERAEPTKSAGERVAVSSLSRSLADARVQPEQVDQAKVDGLRESLRAGSFQVKHDVVADTMLQEEV
jgi:flagellar biosynthesis anti-sigma factor FlgM